MDGNGCVLIKKKELDELKKKAAQIKPDNIVISWRYNTYYRTHSLSDEGSVNLSGKLYAQIHSIAERIHQKAMVEINNATLSGYQECQAKFESLSWWNRLFYKSSGKKAV